MTRGYAHFRKTAWMVTGLGAFAVLLSSCSGHAVRDIQHADASDPQALYYALPRTVLTLEVLGEKTTLVKEAACSAALQEMIDCGPKGMISISACLGVPANEAKEKWTFEKPVLRQRAEPDPGEIFRVDISASALEKTGIGLNLSRQGLITRGESEFQDKRVDIAVAALKSAASLVQPFVGGPESPKTAEPVCKKMVEGVVALRKQANDLLDSIDVSSPVDADALKLRLDSLEARQKELLVNFRSTKKSGKGRIYCEYIPGSDSNKLSLLRLSATEGAEAVTAEDCLIPAVLAAASTPSSQETKLISLDLDKDPDQLSEVLRAKNVDKIKRKKDQGFYYRVPATMSVDIVEQKGSGQPEILQRSDIAVAQAGIVTALPPQNTTQSAYVVEFYEDTGAIKMVTAKSEALDPALITGAADAVSGVIEKDRASTDELEILTRQRKILEETKKIRDFEKALAEGDAGTSGGNP